MASAKSLIALLPAAGAATRFGGQKQLAELGGKSLLAHAIENCRTGGCERVYVISGHQHEAVDREARRHRASVLYHENWPAGMTYSIDFGVRELVVVPDWDRMLILPADMPWFTGEWIGIMAGKVARLADQPEQVVATDYPEGPGVPAILSRNFIEHRYLGSRKTRLLCSQKNNLRKSIAAFSGLKTIPSGPHTKDVDYREDLV